MFACMSRKSSVASLPASASSAELSAAAEQFVNVAPFNPEHIHPQVKAELLEICGEYSWWWANHDDPLQPVMPSAAEMLARIQVPLLIVTAQYDATACLEVATRMERQVARNKRVDLVGATHFMLMEKPGEFNGVLLEFIRDVAAGGAGLTTLR